MRIISTKLFGEIGVDEDKTITFEEGIIGFPDLKHFLLIRDQDSDNHFISWLQSVEEPEYALPVINPLDVEDGYDPTIEDELLAGIEPYESDDILVLTTIRIPENLEEMTSNLRAPFIINSARLQGCQVIVEDEEYKVQHPIYEILKNKKEGRGE
jgi:flagellar assembly factor FliW